MTPPTRPPGRQLTLVGANPRPRSHREEDLVAQRAVAFAALVAEADQTVINNTLEQMSAAEVRALAVALASEITATQTVDGPIPDVGPDAMCALAVSTAAEAFGTTAEAVRSADRHRTVTDARAVAMTAVRRGGMTLPAIATYFGKDHTTVMYAQTKVANNARLNAICVRIVDALEEHYAMPASVPSTESGEPIAIRRSEALQLAALEPAREETTPPRRDDGEQRLSVSAGPAR